MKHLKLIIAEFIGTFVLVFFGCGTAVVSQCSTSNYAGYLITALVFGLSIIAMAYSIGNISGCHINPVVSLAMLCEKRITVGEFFEYILSQFAAGIAAGFVLKLLLGSESGLGTNGVYNGSIILSIIIESILTMVFILVILFVTAKKEHSNIAGIVIGLTLTFVHILGIAFTGTSVNPARSFGPALFVGGDTLTNVWVFIIGPVIGSLAAVGIHKVLTIKD